VTDRGTLYSQTAERTMADDVYVNVKISIQRAKST